ncbi:MAG: hypothetical protein ACRDTA_30355 [Pseudonocardiaceae bacterium]
MGEDLYDGVPVVTLPLIRIDVPDPAHLRRSLRYLNAVDVDPQLASSPRPAALSRACLCGNGLSTSSMPPNRPGTRPRNGGSVTSATTDHLRQLLGERPRA